MFDFKGVQVFLKLPLDYRRILKDRIVLLENASRKYIKN